MICYLPFTCISKSAIVAISRKFGPFSIYTPDQALVPDHMLTAAREGDIELRPIPSLNAERLIPAVQAYKEWANLHQGNLADMAAYFKATGGQFAMMDDTNPSQISTQIRNIGKSSSAGNEDPLFQAALFLCMAQEYDQQQETMRRQLGAVQTMEQEMLSRLAGGAGDPAPGDPGLPASPPPADLEPGGYMTAARVEAWVRLALEDDQPPLVYLTSSPAVLDHLRDGFPEAEAVTLTDINSGDTGRRLSAQKRCDALRRLVSTPFIREGRHLEQAVGAGDGDEALTFYLLNDVPPLAMLQRLCPTKARDLTAIASPEDVRHTLIGLVHP